MKRHKPLLLRWLKFSAVGWMGVGVQLLMLTLLAGKLELHYLVATVLAVESAIIHNFFWHERWTWRDRRLVGAFGRMQRLLRFNLGAGLISITGNVVFMSIFVGKLGLHYLIGNLASIASCAILNFLVSDRLVFRALEPESRLWQEAAGAAHRLGSIFSVERRPGTELARRGTVSFTSATGLREEELSCCAVFDEEPRVPRSRFRKATSLLALARIHRP